jgi:aryl-alcohol dehydrogenase-like predicted oxidoreductase
MQGATVEATKEYAGARVREEIAQEHFREAQGLWLSSIGLGTYLGRNDETTDDLYRRAVVRAAQAGCNVLDTAINYRCQRSERNIREAIQELAKKGIAREQLVVATKGGFIPFESDSPADVDDYLEKNFYSAGLMRPEDVVGGCQVITPGYLENQLERSLSNLGIGTIDIYYVHNPEMQLSEVSRDELDRRLRSVFELLEKAADDGRIQFYGTATWGGYRQSPKAKDYLSLESVTSLAKEAGGENHRCRFVQLPYSLAMTEALTEQNQSLDGKSVSVMQAAEELGVTVMSSASICQGRLTKGLPEWLGKLFKGFTTDAQRSLQFARSTPGLTTALVGMKRPAHVEENLAVAKVPPAPAEDFLKLFEVDNRT